VEAWSGPNQEKNYSTNVLTQGAKVVIKCDQNGKPKVIPDISDKHPGWLEIKPPADSYSWIHQRYITPGNAQTKTWIVTADGPVGIYVGSRTVGDEPRVERVQLTKGTQVIVIGTPMAGKLGGYYYPIQSPDTEPRFIPANAINQTAVTRADPVAARPVGGVAQVSNSVPAANSFVDLFTKADTAERSGRPAEAKALFESAKRATSRPEEQAQCDRRIATLSQGSGWNISAGPNRTVAGTTALYTANTPKVRDLVPGQRQWTEWGVLKRTNFRAEDGQEMFRLEVNGQPYAYAVAQPGYTLSTYVGRMLTLYGLVSTSPDPSMGVMRLSVQHVSFRQ